LTEVKAAVGWEHYGSGMAKIPEQKWSRTGDIGSRQKIGSDRRVLPAPRGGHERCAAGHASGKTALRIH